MPHRERVELGLFPEGDGSHRRVPEQQDTYGLLSSQVGRRLGRSQGKCCWEAEGRAQDQGVWELLPTPSPGGQGSVLVCEGGRSLDKERVSLLHWNPNLVLSTWPPIRAGGQRPRWGASGSAWPRSSPGVQEVLVGEEGDGVDRKGAGAVDGQPPAEDPQPFLPGAAYHAVQHPPVLSLLQSGHLHPGLDHVQGGGYHPGGDACKAPRHQHCG